MVKTKLGLLSTYPEKIPMVIFLYLFKNNFEVGTPLKTRANFCT